MKPSARILLLGLLLLSSPAQATAPASEPAPAQQNATQTAQPAPESSDAKGRADSVRTGVTDTEGTPPVPLTIDQERQAQRIGSKLHCPICSGESITQSQTDISRQMMNDVRDALRKGQSEEQILARFEAAYGERILMEPPKRGVNLLLWTLPVGALLLGVLIWQTYLRRASRAPVQTLSPAEEQRIAELMHEREGRA